MGIRIHSAVVYGVEFTRRETKAFERFMKDKPNDWFLMRYVEQTLGREWAERQKLYKERYRYSDSLIAYHFMKRNKKTKSGLKPYRPFWAGLSGKMQKEIGRNLYDAAADYHKKLDPEGEEARNLSSRDHIWWPESSREGHTSDIFGYVQEGRYASDIDYALLDILDIGGDGQNKTFVVPGTLPWECGTAILKKKPRIWYTHNGENMIPWHYLPEDKKSEIMKTILEQHGGSRREFIAKKKAVWDQYHGELRPYKNYPCEGWNGSDFYFYPIDCLYQLICKHIPTIRYDVMRLEKFLCFYWG